MRSCVKPVTVLLDNDNFWGYRLPADFCAEHEWGVKELKAAFGVAESVPTLGGPLGLDRYAATTAPEHVEFETYPETHRGILLVTRDDWWRFKERPEAGKLIDQAHKPRDLRVPNETGVEGAWNEHSFGLAVRGKQEVARLSRLHDAIRAADVAVWLGGGGPFGGQGLLVVVRSLVPAAVRTGLREAELDTAKLLKAAAETGIEEKILKSKKGRHGGKPFYALSPAWITKDHPKWKETNYRVMFWLNPADQYANNYGWFTVEELEKWCGGLGPIPKTAKETAAAR
jgi:hypothetical protein